MKANANKVGTQPIPGYTLRKRLGAGGYGEVWLADAPGGLQKAVKLVFGSADQSQAVTELKSLQRVKEVTHPFLLSLERIEVVDNQVVIVTELAEGSLLDRFEQYRRKGEPGIPRTLLLEFLHDTADGLDYLASKHSLQHLDVKPGNLLLIADRVKVADFGLVKDLQAHTQSLVSGLTPAYSAPEIFDGRPDTRSDQYSLAIVYMEMLTGHLPFDGKTTGELARQHLSQPPNLEALPPADRPVVMRALSKNSLDRFGSCRQFIEQLQKVRGAVVPLMPTTKSDDGDTSHDKSSSSRSDQLRSATQVTQNCRHEFRARIEVDEAALRSYSTPHCMFMGIGGLGCQALLRLRRILRANCDARLSADEHTWLAIDTAPDQIDLILDAQDPNGIASRQAIQIPIFKPIEYRELEPDLLKPISRRWMYNIPKSLKTEGVRPIAVLAMLDHFESLKAKLRVELSQLIERHSRDEAHDQPLRIYLMASLHGGTGSGLICELGLLIRQLMTEMNYTNYRICAVLSLATCINSGLASLPSAAALACLSELACLMEPVGQIPPIYFKDARDSIRSRPFDWVSMVDGGLHGAHHDVLRVQEDMANTVVVDSQTMLSAALAEERSQAGSERMGWLRVSCASPVELVDRLTQESLAKGCVERIMSQASNYMTGPSRGAKPHLSSTDENSGPPDPNADISLSHQATDELTKRLLSNLGLVDVSSGMDSLHDNDRREAFLDIWSRRLSGQPEDALQQMREDFGLWRNSIANIIQMRVYNWKQIERIQLVVIESIIDYSEKHIDALVEQFVIYETPLGSLESMRAAAIDYLKSFSEKCLQVLHQFQVSGKAQAQRFTAWCESIEAERLHHGDTWNGDPTGLAPELQTLVGHVCSTLESTVHRELLSMLDAAVGKLRVATDQSAGCTKECLSLKHVLTMANDLVAKLSGDMGINLSRTNSNDQQDLGCSIRVNEIGAFAPGLARYGGQLYRFAIAPSEQMQVMVKTLREQRLVRSTTVLTTASSLGSYIVCDGVQTGIPQTLSSLCRPTPQTLQLAERLRTRIDIEWPPVSALFELVEESQPVLSAVPLSLHPGSLNACQPNGSQ